MGREIVYCFSCASRVTEADFERGKAFRSGNKVVCTKCAAELGLEAPPPPATPRRGTSTRVKQVRPAEDEPSELPSKRALSRKTLLIAGGAGGGFLILVVLLIALLLSGGDAEEDAPRAEGPAAAATPVPPIAPPRESGGELIALKALLKAKQYGKMNPDDLAGRIRELKEVAFRYDGSAAARDAKLQLDGLAGKLRADIKKALAALEDEIKECVAEERYGVAVQRLEEAKSRRTEPDWTLGIDRKISDIRRAYRKIFPDLLEEAQEAMVRRDDAAVKKIRDRVAKWGAEKEKKQLEESLAELTLEPAEKPAAPAAKPAPAPAAKKKPTIPVDTPPTTAEGKAYRAAWEQALLRAAVRDHDGAIRRLEEAKGDLKDAALKKEADADVKDVRIMQALWKQALETLAGLPRWRSVALDVRDGTGKLESVTGRNFEAGPDRIELRVEKKRKTIFVEFSDLAGTSLPGILESAKKDPRLLALVCLTEGEREAAEKLLGEKLDSAPAKYWAYAEKAKERIPRPDPDARRKTQNALAIFYAADREYRSMRTLGPAVEKYQRLLDDYSDVSEILKVINRIERRSRECREYLFLARELKGEGTFKLVKPEGEGKCWISQKDSGEDMALYNLVDIQFYALPELTYRLWARVGGCCKDNFFFLYQATDLKVPDDEDRRKLISVTPGSDYAWPVKHRIYNLKRTHASHSKGPKTAARWEWVEIPLGKNPEPGFKHIRFLTDQQGFGVSAALISTTLKRAPSKKDTRAMLDAREEEVPKEVLDPDLVGYWNFEEGDGTRATDATGNGFDAKLTKGASWSEGRIGGALTFTGKEGAAKIADDEVFRLTGDLTIAFWAKKDKEASGWTRMVGKGYGDLRNFGVWEESGSAKRILFQQYDKNGDAVINLNSKTNLAIGKWTHVAAVIRGKKGEVFINGKLDASAERKGTPATSPDPVTFALYKGYDAFPGSLDDVRIYRRALTADEIRALYEGR